MRRFEKEAQNFSRDARVSATLAALQDISRYMAGQRGRKVLIWISAGFPISIVGIQPEDLETSREYSDQIRRTANLLNDAHVAIYAIDAKGLYLGSLSDPENSGRDASGRLTLTVEANRALVQRRTFEKIDRCCRTWQVRRVC